jgi:hypothetical protein
MPDRRGLRSVAVRSTEYLANDFARELNSLDRLGIDGKQINIDIYQTRPNGST